MMYGQKTKDVFGNGKGSKRRRGSLGRTEKPWGDGKTCLTLTRSLRQSNIQVGGGDRRNPESGTRSHEEKGTGCGIGKVDNLERGGDLKRGKKQKRREKGRDLGRG